MPADMQPDESLDARPTRRPIEPQSDLRKAAEHHANTATVLAGFAFAAVILVMQQQRSS